MFFALSSLDSFRYFIFCMLIAGGASMHGIVDPRLLQDNMSVEHSLKNEKLAAEVKELQGVLKTIFHLLVKLDRVNEDILTLLGKGIIRVKESQKALRTMTDIRMNIMSIIHDQTNLLVAKKPAELKRYCCVLMALVEKLSKHMNKIVEGGLKKFPSFDFHALQKESINTNKSVAAIKKEVARLKIIVDALHEKEEYSTLTWYNIGTRKIEKLLSPLYQNNLGPILKISAIGTLVTGYFIWQMGSDYLKHQTQYLQHELYAKYSARDLIEQYPELAREYNFYDTHLFEKGELRNAYDRINGGLSTQYPVKGRPGDSVTTPKYLDPANIDFIEAAVQESVKKELNKSFFNRMLSFIPNKIGHAEPINSHGMIDFDFKLKYHDNYGHLSYFTYHLDQLFRNHFPFFLTISGLAWASLKETWGDGMPGSLGATFQEKLFDAWNFMRGGAHLKQSLSLDFHPTVTFADVIGLEEVKQQLQFILMFIENPEMFIRSGKIPERGYLFTGPTRSGKSFIVEAFCGEIEKIFKKSGGWKNCKYRKIPPYLIAHVGIERILMWAKEQAPIVLWIDEIDLLNLQRVGDTKALMAFLNSMGNSFDNDPNKLVIIIGCTNRPEHMDTALKQYGRFGTEIRFEYPAAEYRRKFIIQQLASMGLDPNTFDIESLTYKTEGEHFEAIKAVIKCASIKAWMEGTIIDQALLDEVFDTEIRHILPVERKILSETERDILATYFAGRAIAHILLETLAMLDRVTIRPIMVKLLESWAYEQITDKEKQIQGDAHKIQYGQVFTKQKYDTAKINTIDQVLNEIKLLLAGFAAEEVLFGASTYSCHPEDAVAAYRLAEGITFEGLDKEKTRLGKEQVKEFSAKAYELRKKCYEEVRLLLEQYKPALIKVKEALKKHSTLTDYQVMSIAEEAMIEAEEAIEKNSDRAEPETVEMYREEKVEKENNPSEVEEMELAALGL